jgi:undecaprenyl-diphosphatase
MKLTWSHNLFLKINSQIGKSSEFDTFVIFCARWLIYLLWTLILWWGVIYLDPINFKLFVKLIITTSVFSITASIGLALFWRHPRPIKELPYIKQIVMPHQTWKSFPSDHTITAFLFVFVAGFMGMPLWLFLIFFMLATMVALGRVYGGVHYPRDIIGGVFFAIFFSSISFWLLGNVAQPVYSFFMNLL